MREVILFDENKNVLNSVIKQYDEYGLNNSIFDKSHFKVKREKGKDRTVYYENNNKIKEVEISGNLLRELVPDTVETMFDIYGRVKSIKHGRNIYKLVTFRYQDEGNPYNIGDPRRDDYTFCESNHVAQVTQVSDPFEECSYNFHYTKDNELYGYDNGNSSNPLEVKQIDENKTKYKYGPNKENEREILITYNKNQFQPRITNTKDDNGSQDNYYLYDYHYDGFSRLNKIVGKNFSLLNFDRQITNYTYNNNNLKQIQTEKTDLMWKNNDGGTTNKMYIESKYNTELSKSSFNQEVVFSTGLLNTYNINMTYEIKDMNNRVVRDNCEYYFDNLNRIVREEHSSLGTIRYSYHENTNLLSKIVKRDNTIVNLEYRNDRLIKVNSTDIHYNYYGTISNYKDFIGYDSRELITTYGTINYKYNYMEQRIEKKHRNGSYSRYYYDGNKLLSEYIYQNENDQNPNKIHFYYNAMGIAGAKYKEINFNFILDASGNVSKVLSNGRLIGEYIYDSYGNSTIRYWFTNNLNEKEFIEKNPFRWKGYYLDLDTGFYLINKRYYDPTIGQFISKASHELIPYLADQALALNLFSIGVSNPFEIPRNNANIMNLLTAVSDEDYDDENGERWFNKLSNKQKVNIGLGVMLAFGILTPVSAIAGAAFIGSMIGGGISSVSGYIIDGKDGAAEGLMMGSIFGALTGGLSHAISGVGSLGGNTKVVQGQLNALIGASTSLLESGVTNGKISIEDFISAGISGIFGYIGGYIGTKEIYEDPIKELLKHDFSGILPDLFLEGAEELINISKNNITQRIKSQINQGVTKPLHDKSIMLNFIYGV